MKKVVFILLCVCIINKQASAQDPLSFGVLTGVSFQNITGKDVNGDKLDNDLIVGIHAGVNAQIPIAPEFYFQPGILYAMKGALTKSELGDVRTSLSYIEFPLSVLYKAPFGTGHFMLGFGPYLAYAVGGTVKANLESLEVTTNIDFQNNVDLSDDLTKVYFRRLDAGAMILVGYEFAGHVFLSLNTQIGLLNMNPSYSSLESNKSLSQNIGFGFSLGYRFGPNY